MRNGVGRRMLAARVCRRGFPDLPTTVVVTLGASTGSSVSVSHRSQRIHPKNVATLLQLTTETGETRS